MRVGYSCVAIMASVGVMVVEIGWQGKKQEELQDQDLETGTYHCPLSYILTAICKKDDLKSVLSYIVTFAEQFVRKKKWNRTWKLIFIALLIHRDS